MWSLSFFIDVILEGKQVLPVVFHWNKHFTCLSVQQVVLFDSNEESNVALELYMLISLLLKHSGFCSLCIQKCSFPLKGPKIHFVADTFCSIIPGVDWRMAESVQSF